MSSSDWSISRVKTRRLRLVEGTDQASPRMLWLLGGAIAFSIFGLLPRKLAIIVFSTLAGTAIYRVLRQRTQDMADEATTMVSVGIPLIGIAPSEHEPTPMTKEQIFISRRPQDVYNIARRLANLRRLLPTVIEVRLTNQDEALLIATVGEHPKTFEVSVIADVPGEFIGFRIECDGALLGNCLLNFDTTPGATGTIVEQAFRLRGALPKEHEQAASVISQGINTYLKNLKTFCEADEKVIPD